MTNLKIKAERITYTRAIKPGGAYLLKIMKPIIDHIQLTVKNLEAAEALDDKLMPVLGFDLAKKSKGTVEAP